MTTTCMYQTSYHNQYQNTWKNKTNVNKTQKNVYKIKQKMSKLHIVTIHALVPSMMEVILKLYCTVIGLPGNLD